MSYHACMVLNSGPVDAGRIQQLTSQGISLLHALQHSPHKDPCKFITGGTFAYLHKLTLEADNWLNTGATHI